VDAQNGQNWIVFATMLAALAAAWIHIYVTSIWYDEAITLLTTSGHAKLNWDLGLGQFKPSANLAKIVVELYQQDVHPPLYFWTLAIWRVMFGESLEVARALSALFTLATLGLLYRLAIELRIKWPALPVVIYAVSAVGLRYAYNARPYAMASFLLVLTYFLSRKQSRWSGFCAAAAISTHYFAALCVLPILLFQCVKHWNNNRRWTWLTLFSFTLCSAPLIPLLRVHIGARPHQYPGFSSFLPEFWALCKGSIEGIMPGTWLPHWGFALCVAAGFVLVGCWQARKQGDWLLPSTYLAFSLGFLLLAIFTNKSIVQMPTDYYLGIASPFLALLIGMGVNGSPRSSVLLALLLFAGTVTPASITKSADYRFMLQQIRSDCPKCPVLVGFGYAGAIPACVLYESDGMNIFLLNPGDTLDETVRRLGNPETLILIPSNEPATTGIERQFVESYPSIEKHGFFEIKISPKALAQLNHKTLLLHEPLLQRLSIARTCTGAD
jgi:Dolichyl-phosphate-mannose-protein mannosyltransferase